MSITLISAWEALEGPREALEALRVGGEEEIVAGRDDRLLQFFSGAVWRVADGENGANPRCHRRQTTVSAWRCEERSGCGTRVVTSASDRGLDRLESEELTGTTSRRVRSATLLEPRKVRSHLTGWNSALRDGLAEVPARDQRGERDLPRPLLPPPRHRDGEQSPPIGCQQL